MPFYAAKPLLFSIARGAARSTLKHANAGFTMTQCYIVDSQQSFITESRIGSNLVGCFISALRLIARKNSGH
jgi:hypothetical protein